MASLIINGKEICEIEDVMISDDKTRIVFSVPTQLVSLNKLRDCQVGFETGNVYQLRVDGTHIENGKEFIRGTLQRI